MMTALRQDGNTERETSQSAQDAGGTMAKGKKGGLEGLFAAFAIRLDETTAIISRQAFTWRSYDDHTKGTHA